MTYVTYYGTAGQKSKGNFGIFVSGQQSRATPLNRQGLESLKMVC
jgi:hypothetical protein